jgi:carboxyl-terminal processing protease
LNKKNLVIYTIVVAIISSVITFFSTVTFSKNIAADYRIKQAYELISTKYYDNVDYDKAMEGAARGIVQSLDDPYSTYMDKQEFDEFYQAVSGEISGIGVQLSADEADNTIVVVAPIDGTPAKEAGIATGDKILAVDGVPYSANQLDEAVTKVRGTAGTDVVLSILKKDATTPTDMTFTRAKFEVPSVTAEMLEDNIAYVRIASFDTNTEKDFKREYEALKANNPKGLILDLRNNPGGVVDVACNIADYFLPEAEIMYSQEKSGDKQSTRSDGNQDTIPMVVLADGGSASSAEILTGALKDNNRATIVGTKTYGKGIMQQVFPINGAYVKVTIARYFIPSGVCIDKVGIDPNVEVEITDPNVDSQLNKALELLK